jgi:hypothetical protein
LARFPVDGKSNQQWVKHIARYGEVSAMNALAGLLDGNSSYDLDTQFSLFQAMSQGMEERGMKPSDQNLSSHLNINVLFANWKQTLLRLITLFHWHQVEKMKLKIFLNKR